MSRKSGLEIVLSCPFIYICSIQETFVFVRCILTYWKYLSGLVEQWRLQEAGHDVESTVFCLQHINIVPVA